MYDILSGLTDEELIAMLKEHYSLFRLDYVERDDVIAEYDLRKCILDILQLRLEQNYYRRMAELGG